MKRNLILIIGLLALLGSACSTLFKESDEHGNIPPAQGATQTNLVVAPEFRVPLETVRDTGLPYASEAAGIVLAILTGYATIRNRRLRKTASVLTENITSLAPTPEGIDAIKKAQEAAGVREEVRSLLK